MEYCYLIAIALIVLGFMLLWGLDIKLSFYIEINNTDRKDVVDETMDEDLSSNKAKNSNTIKQVLIIPSLISIISGVIC